MEMTKMNNTLGLLVSALLVVLVVMVAGIVGYLLSGGRYQATTLKGTAPYGDTIAIIDKFFGAVRICVNEGDKFTCRRAVQIIDAP
jgi:hypothetical protein